MRHHIKSLNISFSKSLLFSQIFSFFTLPGADPLFSIKPSSVSSSRLCVRTIIIINCLMQITLTVEVLRQVPFVLRQASYLSIYLAGTTFWWWNFEISKIIINGVCSITSVKDNDAENKWMSVNGMILFSSLWLLENNSILKHAININRIRNLGLPFYVYLQE